MSRAGASENGAGAPLRIARAGEEIANKKLWGFSLPRIYRSVFSPLRGRFLAASGALGMHPRDFHSFHNHI